MKHLSLLLLLALATPSCKKPCYECKWEAYYGHSQNKYTLKQETYCDEDDVKAHDGKSEYVLTATGWEMAKCSCEEE